MPIGVAAGIRTTDVCGSRGGDGAGGKEAQGKCLLSISTNSKNAPENIKGHSNIESANWVGNELANKMQELNISKIVFNKSGYKFHGKIKAILDSIRNRGIEC